MTSVNEQLLAAAKAGDVAALARLAAAGADVNGHAPGSLPPLVWAAAKGKYDTVLWLLDHGAAVDGCDASDRWRALHTASYLGHVSIASLLLERGASPDAPDKEGRTPLSLATKYNKPDIISLLERPPAPARLQPDEVSFSYPLGDRVLQEIFSFSRRERVSMVRAGERGPVEALTRQAFCELADLSPLRKAFDEYRRRGGEAAEDDIFEGTLAKPAYLPKPKGGA